MKHLHYLIKSKYPLNVYDISKYIYLFFQFPLLITYSFTTARTTPLVIDVYSLFVRELRTMFNVCKTYLF